MYMPKHFSLEELVYPKLYKKLHKKNMLWVLYRMFDDRFLMTIDQFRKDFGSTIINNWSLGKISWLGNQIFNYSGARPPIQPLKEKWSLYTSHKDFNTADLKVEKFSKLNAKDKLKAYNEARQFIIDNPKLYPYVTVLEDGSFAPNWLHLSTGNFCHEDGSIRIIKL